MPEQSQSDTSAASVPCSEQGCQPELTGANCVSCPAIGVPVEITLTADEIARVEHLIATTTDTGAEPVTVAEYVRQVVVRAITPKEVGSDVAYG